MKNIFKTDPNRLQTPHAKLRKSEVRCCREVRRAAADRENTLKLRKFFRGESVLQQSKALSHAAEPPWAEVLFTTSSSQHCSQLQHHGQSPRQAVKKGF